MARRGANQSTQSDAAATTRDGRNAEHETSMDAQQDRLSKVLATADEKLEEMVLKAYRIGYFDGHMNGTAFQREELAALIQATLADLYDTDASEDPLPRGRITPLNPNHPALTGVKESVGHNIRIWAEYVGPV